MRPGAWEILLVVVVLLLLFGAKRLPDTARGLGRSLRIFKSETRGLREDDEHADAGRTDATTYRPAAEAPQALGPGERTVRPVDVPQPPAPGVAARERDPRDA